MCRAHRAQLQRGTLHGGTPRDYRQAPRQKLRVAAIGFRDADADEDFRRSDDLLAKYAVEYAKALGYIRPSSENVSAPADS